MHQNYSTDPLGACSVPADLLPGYTEQISREEVVKRNYMMSEERRSVRKRTKIVRQETSLIQFRYQ